MVASMLELVTRDSHPLWEWGCPLLIHVETSGYEIFIHVESSGYQFFIHVESNGHEMFIHVKSSGYQIFIQVGKGYGIIRPMRAQGDTLC